ncbi:MAG: PepSY domain-containing protein [Paracoccaceae bacterium]|uniref:PepSY domain-containing protein n=1 Tax=Yoonia sp. TaxID=2212373 RepID=UPI00328061D5
MKHSLFSTLLALGIASTAQAQSIADQVVSQLEAEGFNYFEIKNGPNQVKIEAVRGTQEVEYVYDLNTGELLKQEAGTSDAEDRSRSGVQTRTEDRDFVDWRGGSRSDDDERDDDERDDDERDDDERDDDERDDDERDDDERDDDERDDDEDDDDEDDEDDDDDGDEDDDDDENDDED